MDKTKDDNKIFKRGNKEERQYLRFAILKKFEMQEKCKTRGLLQSGTKKVLLGRLIAYEIKRGKSIETAIPIDQL